MKYSHNDGDLRYSYPSGRYRQRSSFKRKRAGKRRRRKISLAAVLMMVPVVMALLVIPSGLLGGNYQKAVYKTAAALETTAEKAAPEPVRILIDQPANLFDTKPAALPAFTGDLPSEHLTETAVADTPLESTSREEASSEEQADTAADETSEMPAIAVGVVLTAEQVEQIGEDNLFWQSKITDSVFSRINGISYSESCPVPRSSLRYLRVLYYDFDGNIRVGELISNQSISSDLLSIFHQLYKAKYPIGKMVLVDEYGGDDDASSSDNNTSCFNYRTVAGTSSLSRHAYGVAIDINPLYNPYVTGGGAVCAPENGRAYMDRTKDFSYKIDENDLCYKLFTQAGFTWGGSWSSEPDYMHFSRNN